jgi:cell division protein FtsA
MKPIIALDIGNQNIKVLAGQSTKDFKIKINAVLERPSDGINKGSINDYGAFVNTLFETFEDLGKLGVSGKHVIVNIASPHSTFKITRTFGGVSRGDGEITANDINQLHEKIKDSQTETSNKTILHIIPRNFTVDDLTNIKDPIGMHGYRLEMEAAIIETLNPHIKTLEKGFGEIKKNIIDKVFSPLAAAYSCLSKKQMNVGSMIVDLGAENTTFAIFEDDKLIESGVLNLGANSITHDIAICLKIPLEVAEKIKITFGYALSNDVNRKENINLSKITKEIDYEINKKYLSEIIEARLEDIFNLLNNEIKKTNSFNKLAAGVVLVGGGSKLPGMVDFTKKYLKLPAKIGYPINLEYDKETNEKFIDLIDDPSFAVVSGLLCWGLNNTIVSKKISLPEKSPILQKLKKFIKIFLP